MGVLCPICPIYGKKWKVIKAMFQTNQPDIHYTVLLFKRKPGGMSWISSTGHSPRFFATFHGEIPQVPVRNCWL